MVKSRWIVIHTPCYPNSWKVVNDQFGSDNYPNCYFPSIELAEKEAARKNRLLDQFHADNETYP